ncbi:hypothetical protein BT93_G0606 [Corymbia citriodora subsp. variegata]|nr:hypothetical protein BT93_G0606 [Corymbia citriodora subsp. variegata]
MWEKFFWPTRERDREKEKRDGGVQAFSAPPMASGRGLCVRRRAARRVEGIAELPVSATRVLEGPGHARSRLQVLRRRRRRVYSYVGRVLLQASMLTVEARLKRVLPFFDLSLRYIVRMLRICRVRPAACIEHPKF